MELTYRNISNVFDGTIKVFSSSGCLYFKSSETKTGKIEGIDFQLVKFSILTYPGFGVPLKAGDFFTINMQSGKGGIYYVVSSGVKEDMADVIAYFVGYYKEGWGFYTIEEYQTLIKNWKSVGLRIQKEVFYTYSEL